LTNNTTGSENVAIGYNALFSATTASENVAIGLDALESVTTGGGNTAIGEKAGYQLTTGSTNVYVGIQAGRNHNTGSNSVFIGNDPIPTTGDMDDQIILGNSSTGAIRCQVQTISSLSDERDKTEIIDSVYGLDVINSLKARQFKWNIRVDPEAMYPVSRNNGKVELGFVAQEINTALGDKNDVIKMVDNTNPDRLDASYGRLIPVLVKAIQELSAEVTALKAA
jgi:hypothetical protein